MKCKCGLEARNLEVKKEGSNKGKKFYACAKPKEEQCDFFEWANENGNTIVIDTLETLVREVHALRVEQQAGNEKLMDKIVELCNQ